MVEELVAHSFEQRERLVAALLSDPSHVLVHHDPVLAVVRAGADDIALLTYGGPGPLLEHIAQLRTAKRTTMLHIVAVGASADATRVMRAQYSMWKAIFAYHRVGADGTYEKVAGRGCKPLEKAAHVMASFAPLGAEGLAAAAENSARAGRERASFEAALTRGFPVVTTVIGVVCTVLFALQWYWGDGDELGAIFRMGGNERSLVMNGEYWRLLASAFLHGGWEHLAVNMVVLAIFGPMLESLLGRARYIALYGLSALAGSVASAALNDVVSVGASGALWGLMAAGVGLALRPRGLLPASVIGHARQRALLPLIINVVGSFSIEGIDIWAHFGGGAAGLVLMLTGIATAGLHPAWTEHGPSAPPRAPAAWIALAAILSAAIVGSIGAALATGKPWELRQPPRFERTAVGDTGISIELPPHVAAIVTPSTNGAAKTFVYGRAGTTLVVEVMTFPAPSPLSEAQRSRDFDDALRQWKTPMVDGTKVLAAPAVAMVGDRRWVTARYGSDQLQFSAWFTAMNGIRLSISIFLPPDAPSAWADVAEHIVGSLERQP